MVCVHSISVLEFMDANCGAGRARRKSMNGDAFKSNRAVDY